MRLSFFLVFVLPIFTARSQSSSQIVVKVDKPVAEIQPTMWGIFFEDINFAADGGIYAELVKNRSFEFYKSLMGWKEENSDHFSDNKQSGYTTIINRGEENPSNPRFARINVLADKGYGLTNEGFRGMGIKKDVVYHFSILGSQHDGSSTSIRVELKDSHGNIVAGAKVAPSGSGWKKYEADFASTVTDPKGSMTVWFEGKGTLDIDMVSLFPDDTWKNRPGGLRADLVQLLADMKPGFLRFPGGCIVEGHELATRYQWKKTVGKVEDRELIINRWNREFDHRPAPDYFQSFGLGFFEYFQLAEDIGAEPLPILNCGMACQFNSAELVPINQLDPYIQDALDLIEFANGSAESQWGKLRIAMGHAAPFNLKMIGVGNEQWGPQYLERYQLFVKAVKSKYPSIKIVTSNGPFPDGELFDYADQELRAMNADIIDEHYYRNPEWFLENATRYDKYDRNGPKIFAGEYAAQSVATVSPANKNDWRCALSEAAFMTGLERNAQVVTMCSYAPLFAHVDGWQWTPDLIWFDNLNSYGTPNYYVQKLYANHKGTHVLSMLSDNLPLSGQGKLYASAVFDRNSNEVILKMVNASDHEQKKEITLDGVGKVNPNAMLIVLKGDKPDAVNSLSEPTRVSPVEQTIILKGKKLNLTLAPNSFSVVKIKLSK
ncbi:MAG TPA: alpha-L-arabinofuranosidase C-terminal domain-containing protein [Cyclobacteriaceae bacterium]|nr:alpha-L-arabinofuranosidase C-terminal domain-containing protein [Cyclobacteriaceae bacterium]